MKFTMISLKCVSSVLVPLLAIALNGCVEQTRLLAGKQHFGGGLVSNRLAELQALKYMAPCCSAVTELRVSQTLSSEREAGFSLGTWPANSVIDVSGFRSYAALVAFDESPAKRTLELFATESYLQGFDPASGRTEKEVIVPRVTFLDAKRKVISTENPTQAGFVPHHVRYVVRVPEDTAFVVVHTSADRFASDVAGSPTANATFAPVGAGGILLRTPGVGRYVPAVTGGIRLKLL